MEQLKVKDVCELPNKRSRVSTGYNNGLCVGYNEAIEEISALPVNLPQMPQEGLVAINKLEIGTFLASFGIRACQITADNWVDFIANTTDEFCQKFGTQRTKAVSE